MTGKNASDIQKHLKGAISQYRIAVRWLKDARTYKASYAQDLTFSGKAWKNNGESQLAIDAQKAYREAVNGVLYWRKQINKYNEELMDLAKEKSGSEKWKTSK